ncbi:helix-turn-helix transcriptional regulator [Microbispora sp. ATCC PTA-5024]|uniref:helix-turn-helix transcriptional regulator n=1 Tax=Microbispora sp. ATCC PTA-5024 TaxID=316330 RepID=UPI0003DDA584|nr:helix-turn-helix transcriptional regulator [Microbispora sp. ATCC PTA-5024]ETK31293.1 XRE family transcriptional regulator [Microbispora sp. ATCC PTA-5024]
MENPLGDFLRARRQIISPAEVGLPRGVQQRRTPGLRRDEVAVLTGVSVDYYTRLEQGRERRPSDQVLGALARALRLDTDAADHLHELARPRARASGADGDEDRVSPQVLRLMNRWDDVLSVVLNRRTDVLAHNALWAGLTMGLEHTDNFIRMYFLNPASRDLWVDWEEEARAMVAHLRAAVGADHRDPSLAGLVEELSEESEAFRQMWARHDVRVRRRDIIRLRHSVVGDVTLWHESFSIDGAPGQRLFTAQAEPGSASERAMAELRAMAPPVDRAGGSSSR